MGKKYPDDPQVRPLHKALEKIGYRHDWGNVFHDFVTMFYLNFLMPLSEEGKEDSDKEMQDLIRQYNTKEREGFKEAFHVYLKLMLDKLPEDPRNAPELIKSHSSPWFDALGTYYEWVSSNYKAKSLGQFFTPEHLCDMMAMFVCPDLEYHPSEIYIKIKSQDPLEQLLEARRKSERLKHPYTLSDAKKIGDPSCGSGRLLLAANSMNKTPLYPPYLSGVDLDRICAKMTISNFIVHGCWGEVIHGNSLAVKRFDCWRVIPPQMHKIPYLPLPIVLKIPEDQTYDYQCWEGNLKRKSQLKPEEKKESIKDWREEKRDKYIESKGKTTEQVLEELKNKKPKVKRPKSKTNKENNQTSLLF